MTITDDRLDATTPNTGSPSGSSTMRVRKRNGDSEPVDVNKIVRAVQRCADGLDGVEPLRIATRTISGLCDGATTEELDELSIRTAAGLIVEEPNYSRLAARLLSTYIDKEVQNQDVYSFSQSISLGHRLGLVADNVADFVALNFRKLNDAIAADNNARFEFFGLRTVYDRYLLRHPSERKVIETPQYFFLRVACGLSQSPDEAIRFYRLLSSLAYLPSSPTLFNSGTAHPQMSSCYLLDSPEDDLESIYNRYTDVAKLSKFAHSLNLANWVPDLFMQRVEKDWMWSLFDPAKAPHLTDLFGDDFEQAYLEAEAAGIYEKQVPARELYSRMMRTLAQTGNGWMTFKDPSNKRCNQTGQPGRVVHLSNLCTEIIEVTDQAETAVCNLGSVNLGALVHDGAFDFVRLGEVVRTAVPFLDRVIDINYYPTEAAGRSNDAWRPVGLGLMGLQDVFFKLRLPFDSPEARALSRRISEEMYFHALWASTELAEQFGPHPRYNETRASQGHLQFDLAGAAPTDTARWHELRERITAHGLRNSLMIAIAPTATIASIAGCYECIEPQVSNLFKRETLSGEFLQINRYLVRDLQRLGLWTEDMQNKVKRSEGSVQNIDGIPAELQDIYRTAWEIPMRSLIDMAAERGAFIDQSQSLNLFMESPTIGKLSSMYLHAWKAGLKTTYYLRSRPATRINQTTSAPSSPTATVTTAVPAAALPATAPKVFSDAEAVACSLENPEACEACD
jgi:ribonucleoside-diphosphate reductase alpha chain